MSKPMHPVDAPPAEELNRSAAALGIKLRGHIVVLTTSPARELLSQDEYEQHLRWARADAKELLDVLGYLCAIIGA